MISLADQISASLLWQISIPTTTQIRLVSQLAKQESEELAPKVYKLPLPITDSPLVIDLPDGQKIVVGKMTQGSVIEVATWRGVGRPDSRTSRLMLGMGDGNVNEDDGDETGESGAKGRRSAPKPKGFAGFVFTLQNILKNLTRINWRGAAQSLISSVTSVTKKARKSRAATAGTPHSVTDAPRIFPEKDAVSIDENSEIEAWLDKITESATRTSKAKKPAAKSAVKKTAGVSAVKSSKPAAKKAVVTKKAAPKSVKKR
jgi:hypothetical protein